MKKIAIVYGTRPELIKLVPLIKKMEAHPLIHLFLISTGQHKEMVEEIENTFNIQPSINLGIMQHNQTLTDIMVNVATKIEPVLKKENIELVLVQGDTSTASTVATVCFYNKISIGHVEAGLRSFNMQEPFPEEYNRRLISLIAKYNFTPTSISKQNLLNEGISSDKIFTVGNTIVDMVELVKTQFDFKSSTICKRKILITAHRRENHGQGLKNICIAVKKTIALFPDVHFTWPLHPNPNVLNNVMSELANVKNVTLTQPMTYLELTKEMNDSYLIWTDSGGIQEESPSFKKTVLILRNVTERPEVVDSGFGVLVGTDVELIVSTTKELMENASKYNSMISGLNPFGDGNASQQIIEILLKQA